jgi:glycosyltransferase involved in cell wall biosynthesis
VDAEMKPFLLVTGDFVRTGGMDRANYALADYLARQSAEVHLVAHRVDAQLQQYPNVFWHRVPKIAKSYFLSGFLLDAVGQFWARRVVKQGGWVLVNGGNCQWSDVNWVHYVHAAYQPEARASLLQRVKVALTHWYFRHTEERSLKSAQIIITNSERTQSDLIQHNLITSAKVRPIYYGIDASTFYPANSEEVRSLRQQLGLPLDRPILVFIGALGDRRKGFDALFRAWQCLCQDPTWDAQLLVIGQGAELEIWKRRLVKAQLVDRIQFLGFRSDVPDLLRAADGLIAPTRYEAYGLGVHEALCCGIPALVGQIAGVAERYPTDLKDLLLPNPITPEAIVSGLQHWRQSKELYRERIQGWSEHLRQYTWDTMAQTLLATLEDTSDQGSRLGDK